MLIFVHFVQLAISSAYLARRFLSHCCCCSRSLSTLSPPFFLLLLLFSLFVVVVYIMRFSMLRVTQFCCTKNKKQNRTHKNSTKISKNAKTKQKQRDRQVAVAVTDRRDAGVRAETAAAAAAQWAKSVTFFFALVDTLFSVLRVSIVATICGTCSSRRRRRRCRRSSRVSASTYTQIHTHTQALAQFSLLVFVTFRCVTCKK